MSATSPQRLLLANCLTRFMFECGVGVDTSLRLTYLERLLCSFDDLLLKCSLMFFVRVQLFFVQKFVSLFTSSCLCSQVCVFVHKFVSLFTSSRLCSRVCVFVHKFVSLFASSCFCSQLSSQQPFVGRQLFH